VGHEFSWSASRHDSFQTCARKYYYSYYASQEDPEVARLKRLSALPLWAGSVVHEVIEEFLKSHEALPSEAEQEAIVRSAVHSRMLSDWRESEAGPSGFRLFEHEYETPVEQEDKKIAVGTVMRSLRHFFRSPTLAEALAVGRRDWLSIEDLVSFDVDGVLVFLRMDLAFRGRDGRVLIVDWKTGWREGRFNAVQLAGYALYAAAQGWVARPEELDTELAYLVHPRYVRRRVDGRQLDEARRFVARSAARMQALLIDRDGNLARIDDFPRVDKPQVCRRCSFRRLCYPRGEAAAVLEPIAPATA
jgi:CRISPR/Cas system-associated exonuclease Cas4 (RecB family)